MDCDTILTIRRFAADDEIGGTNAEKIWNYFLMHGFTKEGAAGIMGNIANEASTDLNPTLLEYGATSRTSLSGEQYTNLVDAGIISRDEVIRSSRFGLYSGGRYGYGLCGFTDPTIKEYLCRYTIDLGKSLGSLSGQLDSLMAYLSDYNPNLLDRLKMPKMLTPQQLPSCVNTKNAQTRAHSRNCVQQQQNRSTMLWNRMIRR